MADNPPLHPYAIASGQIADKYTMFKPKDAPYSDWKLSGMGDAFIRELNNPDAGITPYRKILDNIHSKAPTMSLTYSNHTDTLAAAQKFKEQIEPYVSSIEEETVEVQKRPPRYKIRFTMKSDKSMSKTPIPEDPEDPKDGLVPDDSASQTGRPKTDLGDPQRRQQTVDAGTDAGGPNPDTETSIAAGALDELSRTFRIPVSDIRAIIQRDPMLTKTLKKLSVQRAVAVGSTLDQRKEARD